MLPGCRTGKHRGPGDFPKQLIMSAPPLAHTPPLCKGTPSIRQKAMITVKSQRSQWDWHPPELCNAQPAQPHWEAELSTGMGLENASSSRGSSDTDQKSQTTGLESCPCHLLALWPQACKSPSLGLCVSGDDNSTCHTGMVKVINIHISCSRKGFFLDRTAWPFWNRTFRCREQRRPVSESEARKLLGRQASSHFPDG